MSGVMRKRVIMLSLSTTLMVVGWGCSRSSEESSAMVSTVETEGSDLPVLGTAPAWSLTRLDGTTLDSKALAGKVVVVDFWATWCPPCRAEIPGYIAMQRELESQDVVVVGVSLDKGGPEVVQRFVQREGINYEIVMGDSQMVSAFGGVEVIPTTFLIDRTGKVRHRKEGAMDRADYEPFVRSLL